MREGERGGCPLIYAINNGKLHEYLHIYPYMQIHMLKDEVVVFHEEQAKYGIYLPGKLSGQIIYCVIFHFRKEHAFNLNLMCTQMWHGALQFCNKKYYVEP